MDALFPYMLLIVGFFALIKGADYFVEGSAAIAKRLHIPDIIVGLTIVAFGTSAPELAVSATAAIAGSSALAMGNVVGSNLFNVLVILGISALFKPILVDRSILRRDMPVLLLSAILLPVAALIGNGTLPRWSGFVLLSLFIGYVALTVRSALAFRKEELAKGVNPDADEPLSLEEAPSLLQSLLFTLGGAILIVCAAEASVHGATEIARQLGISESVIGLTVVAFGTSLPELVTSIVAARKGNNEIAIGNVVGSNIFNVLLILGTAVAIRPAPVDLYTFIDQLVMVGMSGYFMITLLTGKRISRGEGLSFLALYAGYTAYLFVR